MIESHTFRYCEEYLMVLPPQTASIGRGQSKRRQDFARGKWLYQSATTQIVPLAGETCVGRGASTCNQSPSPQICVYGYCHPCVPSGEECKLFGTQLCCNPDDSCALDINDEKVKCM